MTQFYNILGLLIVFVHQYVISCPSVPILNQPIALQKGNETIAYIIIITISDKSSIFSFTSIKFYLYRQQDTSGMKLPLKLISLM
jgi:hypothetical protein